MSNKMPMMKFQCSPGIATLAACLCLAAVAHAQRAGHPPAINSPNTVNTGNTTAQFGSPLPGLSAAEITTFMTGQVQFQKFDNVPVDGLGPVFNAQACVACHTQPNTSATPKIIPPTSTDVTTAVVSGVTPGGASAITEMRAGKLNPDGSFNPLANEDGTLFHVSSITPMSQETVPQDATIRAHRKATPLFGLGLMEAIPDAEIQANVHTTPVDGVTGRAAVLNDAVTTTIAASNPAGARNFVGRFGWKAQEATVLSFAGDAYLNEMGITNRFFTTDLAPDGNQAALLAAEPAGITPTTLQDTPTNPGPEGSASYRPTDRTGSGRERAIRPDQLCRLPQTNDEDRPKRRQSCPRVQTSQSFLRSASA
jgi:CxxC motif-containing protein (DUF1111 family)